MTTIVLMALLASQNPFENVLDLPVDAKPSHIPAVASKAPTPRGQILLDRWVRGYHPLRWQYTVHMPLDEMRRALVADYRQGIGKVYSRELRDREQSIVVEAGRLRRDAHGSEYAEADEYATLILEERPLVAGPVPKAWPSAGVSPKPPVAVMALALPSLGALEPLSVTKDITPAGMTQAWIKWIIPYDSAQAAARIERDIDRGAPWVKKGSRYYRTDGPDAWIDIQFIGKRGTGKAVRNIWGLSGGYIVPGSGRHVPAGRSTRAK